MRLKDLFRREKKVVVIEDDSHDNTDDSFELQRAAIEEARASVGSVRTSTRTMKRTLGIEVTNPGVALSDDDDTEDSGAVPVLQEA